MSEKDDRDGMAGPEDLADELGVSLGVAYDICRSGVVPVSRAGKRYLIAWATIARIKRGEIVFSMPRSRRARTQDATSTSATTT
jgi:hypothetical protein